MAARTNRKKTAKMAIPTGSIKYLRMIHSEKCNDLSGDYSPWQIVNQCYSPAVYPSLRLCLAIAIVVKSSRCQNYKKKGVNTLPKVTLRSDESQEQLLRRFSREVVKSRLLTDVRRKRWFVSKSELTRIAKKKAARRTRKSQKEQQQGV